MDAQPSDEMLDCLIVGTGPAGLTAALYLARYNRRTLAVDAGDPRAAWIPVSHNIPFFAEGISGADILARQRKQAAAHGARIAEGEVVSLTSEQGGFRADCLKPDGSRLEARSRFVLLATGSRDVEPDLPGLRHAVKRGLIRYCPICDGYEAAEKTIAVIGRGERGFGEARFIARTHGCPVTLLTLGGDGGEPLKLGREAAMEARRHRITVVETPVAAIDIEGDRIVALRFADGGAARFDVLYSALGLERRSELALALGAERDPAGALIADPHLQTSVPGLYAAGGVTSGLDQVVVAMGEAAIAATAIHNACAWRAVDPAAADEAADERQELANSSAR